MQLLLHSCIMLTIHADKDDRPSFILLTYHLIVMVTQVFKIDMTYKSLSLSPFFPWRERCGRASITCPAAGLAQTSTLKNIYLYSAHVLYEHGSFICASVITRNQRAVLWMIETRNWVELSAPNIIQDRVEWTFKTSSVTEPTIQSYWR